MKYALLGLLWSCTLWLVLRTALAGYLAGYDIPPQMFRAFNPTLFQALADSWNQVYRVIMNTPGYVGTLIRIGGRLVGIY